MEEKRLEKIKRQKKLFLLALLLLFLTFVYITYSFYSVFFKDTFAFEDMVVYGLIIIIPLFLLLLITLLSMLFPKLKMIIWIKQKIEELINFILNWG